MESNLKKPRTLFISAHIPSSNALQAGHKTAFAHLQSLKNTYDIDLFLISTKETDKTSSTTFINEVHDFVHINHSFFSKLLGIFYGLISGVAPRFSTRISLRASRKLKYMLSTNTYDHIWFEFSQVFWYSRFVPSNIPITMSSHDIQTMLVSSKKSVESCILMGFTFSTERSLLKLGSSIRVQSRVDQSILINLFRFNPRVIYCSSPVLSEFIFNVRRSNDKIEPFSLLFWGAMSRSENYMAILNFIKMHFDSLKKSFPLLKIYIVGSSPPSILTSLADDSIIVTGFVDDPTPYFERTHLGIAPLMEGAGIKVKVLEMLKSKIPVISTNIGSEGIAESDLLTICDFANFGNVIASKFEGIRPS